MMWWWGWAAGCRIYCERLLLGLPGSQDRGHPAAFHPRCLVDLGDVLQFFDEAPEQVHPLILIDDVAPTKLNPGLNLVIVLEEAARVLRLKLEVVRVGMRPEPNLLHLYVLRLLPRFLLFLLYLVAVLTVVDDLNDGRVGRR